MSIVPTSSFLLQKILVWLPVFFLFTACPKQNPLAPKVDDTITISKGSWGPALLKGINCGTWQNEADLSKMKAWGVTVLRVQLIGDVYIPVSENSEWTLSRAAFENMDNLLFLAKKHGLKVIFDLHNHANYFPDDNWSPGALEAWRSESSISKLANVWRGIAKKYKDERDIIAGYDLLNEPHPPNTAEGYAAWNQIAKRVTQTIREIDRYHTLVVESTGYAEAPNFAHLEPTGDPNTVYSFHFYRPHEFAEQGTRPQWPYGDDNLSGYSYPANIPLGWDTKIVTRVDRAYLESGIQAAIQFQKKHQARIWVGEFSALRWAAFAPGDTVHNGTYHYLKDCLEMFTREGWDWSYHGFMDSTTGTWSLEHSTDRADKTIYPTTDRLELLKSFWKSFK